MIPVRLAAEPQDFDERVRQPGLSAIDEMLGRAPRAKRPGPPRKKMASSEADIPPSAFPPFWRRVLATMLDVYERRCAYLAMYFEPATSTPTVDHALPKSYAWDRVYEWSNYRLCAAIVNTRKAELLTLVDPFDVQPGWFQLNVTNFHVERGWLAPTAAWPKVDATLPLLNQRDCWKQREEYVIEYQRGGIDLAYLERRAPFIARELRRQGQLLLGDA